MKRSHRGKRESRAGGKSEPSSLGASKAANRSRKQKSQSTGLRFKKSSNGKSPLKASESGGSLPRRAPGEIRKGNSSAVEYLAGHWDSILRPERIRRLQSLIGGGWKIRALARALKVVSESRIRQLLKSGQATEPVNGRADSTATAPHAHGTGKLNSLARHQAASISVKRKSGPDRPPALPQPRDHGVAESPDRTDQQPSPAGISPSSGKQSAARPAVPDYAIKDPAVGGQIVATWIRSNFKHSDWPDVIADYTTAYWFTRWRVHKDVKRVNNIPAGLPPFEVIRYCQSDAIKTDLEGGFSQDARRKWFVCWASILLPDPSIRRKAVELAGQILDRPAARWSYMAYDPHLNQPTPCIRS